jgi:hypothetical protein
MSRTVSIRALPSTVSLATIRRWCVGMVLTVLLEAHEHLGLPCGFCEWAR